MTKQPVHVALVEVRRLTGCVLAGPGTAGAFARCYVRGDDPRKARRAIARALHSSRLSVKKIEWCVREDQVKWERADSRAAKRCVEEARKSGLVVIGRLDTW